MCADILQGNFKPDYYLKHIQKDLRLAISMGDMANHPTPMAAAANEVHHCDEHFFSLLLFLGDLVLKKVNRNRAESLCCLTALSPLSAVSYVYKCIIQ